MPEHLTMYVENHEDDRLATVDRREERYSILAIDDHVIPTPKPAAFKRICALLEMEMEACIPDFSVRTPFP